MRGPTVSRIACLLVLVAVYAFVSACNMRSEPPPAASDTSAKQLPFTENAKAETVPPGTTIYVRLQQPLSSATAQVGQEFSAVLDEPLVVANQTVVASAPAGTAKELARADSAHLPKAEYIPITLAPFTLTAKP